MPLVFPIYVAPWPPTGVMMCIQLPLYNLGGTGIKRKQKVSRNIQTLRLNTNYLSICHVVQVNDLFLKSHITDIVNRIIHK